MSPTGARHRLERLDGGLCGPIEPALEVDRAGAGRHIAHAVGKDGVRQDGRAVLVPSPTTSPVLFGGLPQHLRAEILLRILEIEFLGDSHAVVTDDGRTPFLLNKHGLRLGA